MEEENQLMETVDLDNKMENRESEGGKLMFTIRIMPGTTMHIKIESQDRHLPQGGTWCISTLLIHNGQHYASTIHNCMVNMELLPALSEIHHETSVENLLPQMLMPLDLPRNPVTTIYRILGNTSAPLNAVRSPLMDSYYSYVRSMAVLVGNMFKPVLGNAREMPSLLSQSLHTMLGRVERSMGLLTFSEDDEDDESDENEDNNENQHNENVNDNVEEEESTNSTDSDSDGIEESLCNCNDDDVSFSVSASVSASETCGGHHQHPQHDPIFFGSPGDFEERWSMTSSEGGNDDALDDSWESDSEDNEAFDAYMMRHVRSHASGLVSRLNAEWVNATNHHSVAPPGGYGGFHFDLGSCNSLEEIDDVWSEMSGSSVDLDAWQYTEDRSFETALSRPFRRLIGELPAQTAQQERLNWSHFADFLRFEPLNQPLSSFGHWRPQENLATASNNIRSGINTNINTNINTHNLRPSQFQRLLNESFEYNMAQLRQNMNLLEWDMEPDPATETESEADKNYQELSAEDKEIPSDQQVVPLASYLQQTEELIAQLKNRLPSI